MSQSDQSIVERQKSITKLANEIAKVSAVDILWYNGPLYRFSDERVRDLVHNRNRRDNVLMIIATYGGSAHTAFRIARCLQSSYKKFTLYFPSVCGSAGTLLAIGAHELVMSGCSELGPLDVQVLKQDELGERESGLAILEAMNTLQSKAFSVFEESFLNVRFSSNMQISTKSCLEIAEKLAVGLFQPIYAQFDPVRIGEMARSLLIAHQYGHTLSSKANNLRDEALAKLVSGYPSHDFIIDIDEATTLFKNIRKPVAEEAKLISQIGFGPAAIKTRNAETQIFWLSDEKLETTVNTNTEIGTDGNNQGTSRRDSEGAGEDTGPANSDTERRSTEE